MSLESSGATCSEVYLRAPAALSIMIRELCSTSSRATLARIGVEAMANSATPARATMSSSRLNLARSPMTVPTVRAEVGIHLTR